MLKPLLITGLLSISTMAWSAVDWTPYLQIIKDDGCEFAIMDIPQEVLGGGSRADIPKKLQPTIASYKHTANGLDVHLKDATAFGYPITRIVARTTNNDAFLDVYFANANFTQLKSQFTTEVDGKTYTIGTKRAWGIRDTRIETGEMDEFDNPVTLLSDPELEHNLITRIDFHLFCRFDEMTIPEHNNLAELPDLINRQYP